MRKIRFFKSLLVFTLLVITSHINAQPAALWIHNYENRASECFYDVYAVSDSG